MNTRPHSLTGKPQLPPGSTSFADGMAWMRDTARDYVGTMSRLKKQHGDIVMLQVFHERVCLVFSPELIRQVLVDNASHLIRHERLIDAISRIHGGSIMVSEGEDWQRQHRLLRPGFSPKRVAGYASLMVNAIGQALDSLQAPDKGLIDITALMHRLTMDVILRALFGQPADGQRDQVIHAIQTLDEIIMGELFWPKTLPDWLPLPGKARKRQALKTLDELIGQRIRNRLMQRQWQRQPDAQAPSDSPQDILAMLMDARSEELPQGLSLQEVHDQCKVVFLAGQETSAVALIWWSWLMASHPEAAAKAHAEVDACLGPDGTPTPDDLNHMPWLVATLKEAMRLYPPATSVFTRRTLADIEVGGYTLPARTMVFPVMWAAHHDERWFAEPQAFRPERFMPDAPPIPRGAWMPFGAGPRVCIGQHFAMLEMGLVAAMLLQRFSLRVDPDQPPPRAEMQITYRPTAPMMLKLDKRT